MLTPTDDQNTSPDTGTNHEESEFDPTEQIKVAITSNDIAAVAKILDANPNVLDTWLRYPFSEPIFPPPMLRLQASLLP